ncbi:hypothetical protein ACQ4PT_015833 [Festuca glaucescens]
MEAALVLVAAVLLSSSALVASDFCVCRSDQSTAALQKAIDYSCGQGADCTEIQQTGACYNPNDVASHFSWAANSYFQKNRATGATCDFTGVATLSSADPSTPRASPVRMGSPALPSASPLVDEEVLVAQAPPSARAQSPPSAAPWPVSWASASVDDDDADDDNEELAPWTPMANPAIVLAAAVLAARKADPAIAGRLARPHRRHRFFKVYFLRVPGTYAL